MQQALVTSQEVETPRNSMKKRKVRAPWTMVMQIANAHSFSLGFIGIQLTHGYVAALALSSICVVVGMVITLLTRLHGNLPLAIAFGIPVGAVVAFVFDSMTMFGLRMIRESKSWKKWFAFLILGVGIGLSTLAGDQMWNMVYGDWRGLVLAASVSCVIIMVEVWHKEHDEAVKKASTQSDAMQIALNTEVDVVIDKMLRKYTHERLNSPEMQDSLREKSQANLDELVKAKFDKRLAAYGEKGGISIDEKSDKALKRNLYREHY